ncbi:MAG: Peptidoglycan D,D-transpeptidase MrdA [Gammaproteobacteria bacterium]|nr:Peptidoglycan D,D-transpeptidase MrdA [Gammaproteobacteria bacterium]
MPQFLSFRDRQSEVRIARSRVFVATALMILMLFALLARLAYLQIVRHDHYTTLSRDNRVKIVPVAPTRGLIFSRDGILLADNRPSFRLQVVPERIEDMREALAKVSTVVDLTPSDIERFQRLRKRKRSFDTVPLRFNLTEEEVARFSVDRHRFPGFEVTASLTRHYPVGAPLVHAVGYVGRIDEDDLDGLDPDNYSATTHIGKIGVEQYYEATLHGRVGLDQVEVNSQGRTLRVLDSKPPGPGATIRLTIDTRLQAAATRALGDRRGAVVAIDPNTGEVLALVSTPTFDPNPFVNGISAALFGDLRDSPDRPLFNRALQAAYPPGSTLKPLMALAGLHYGLRSPADGTWCPGWFALDNDPHRYRCWNKWGHGRMVMREAIAQSCDVYFYQLALDLGIDRMHDFLDMFGLGRRTRIDLPGEAAGVNPSRAWKRKARNLPWYPGETLIAGIGQGFHTTTPLQLAQAAAVIASRGTLMQPHLVSRIETADGKATPTVVRPRRVLADLDPKAWDSVIDAMHAVVQGPTGTARRSAEGAPYEYAGKTGTSQLFGIRQNEEIETEDIEERLRDHALFIAFAPLDRPEIALAVIVENGASGSGSAAPVARKVLDEYFLRMGHSRRTAQNG